MLMIVECIVAFLAAAIISNLVEWFTHKFILHGLGKKKGSFFHFHWQHHHISRKNKFVDDDYKLGFFKVSAVRREVLSLVVMLLFNINWLFVWPPFFYSLVFFQVA